MFRQICLIRLLYRDEITFHIESKADHKLKVASKKCVLEKNLKVNLKYQLLVVFDEHHNLKMLDHHHLLEE